jgi:hypothetical protein
MKTTGSTKNEKMAKKKSLLSIFKDERMVLLTNDELKHIKGGEDEGGEEKSDVKLG